MTSAYKRDLFQLIEHIKPSEVFDICGVRLEGQKHLGAGHISCFCPFPGHNDNKLGSFEINDEKGIAFCFACGRGGKNYQIYKDLNGLPDDYTASVMLARDVNLISDKAVENMLREHNNESFAKPIAYKPRQQVKKTQSKKVEQEKEIPVAELERRSAFYKELVRHLPLEPQDARFLVETRNIPESELYRFFTYSHNAMDDAFAETKAVLGWVDKEYLGIPGIFMKYNSEDDAQHDVNGHLHLNSYRMEAIGLIIYDEDGNIPGIQYRLYEKKGGRRYLWLTSSFAEWKPGSKYRYGKSAGIYTGFVNASKEMKAKAIGITEGQFKAMKMAEYGINSFSAQSVMGCSRVVEHVCHFRDKNPEYKTVWLGFDADAKENPMLVKPLLQLIQDLESNGFDVKVMDWDIKYGKGIDDVLNNGNNKKIHLISRETYVHELLA